MPDITEAKVREIEQAKDLSKYSQKELRYADAWIKSFALRHFELVLRAQKVAPAIRGYLMSVVTTNYGSVETDELLQKFNCYPNWKA